ncbi:MAG: 16S rRNA (guanine1207-N2)-methyltransferase RsmC [Rhodobacteraceae bacterium HLUCCA12]|nr:MAG: 16S rRNA (guanine1207-N2)-methyltransferase RsmC [Rhodobacteraceae bacterium HLUCCA12]
MSSVFTDPAPRALRLELAFEAGLPLPADGSIAVLHPRAGESLAPLPRARVRVVTPHAADHAAFSAQGHDCVRAMAPSDTAAAVMVCLPRARIEAMDLIAQACARTDGPVIIDGQKADGVDAILKALRQRVTVAEAISKAHGKIYWFASPGAAAMADWRAPSQSLTDEDGRRFITQPGLFSADAVDPGSALLARSIAAESLSGTIIDLGAGWGYLAATLLERSPRITALHLVESDARALDCARENVTDPRAVFYWADATLPLPGLTADLVVMNPPFHTGRKGQPGLGIAFIRAAAALLRPSGQLWLVANRHLPYEAAMAASFRSHTEVAGTPAFKVLLGANPVRGSAGRPSPARERRKVSHARGGRA